MKHKHAELIKAWADGAKIQISYTNDPQHWEDIENPFWYPCGVYRIKPEPKPDVIGIITMNCDFNDVTTVIKQKLIIDGETGKLKSAEVIE